MKQEIEKGIHLYRVDHNYYNVSIYIDANSQSEAIRKAQCELRSDGLRVAAIELVAERLNQKGELL